MRFVLPMRLFLYALLCCALVTAHGCSAGAGPFLSIQMCLSDQEGLSTMLRELQSIAASEQMDFKDDGEFIKRSMVGIYPATERTLGSPVVFIHLRSEDGTVLGMTNLGLPGYQVLMSFSEGSEPSESRAFTRRVLGRIKQRWRVFVVPPESGAQPLSTCP